VTKILDAKFNFITAYREVQAINFVKIVSRLED